MLPAGIIPDLNRSRHSGGFALVVFQEPSEPFATLHRTLTPCGLPNRRKEQDVALALVIALVMKVLHIVRQCIAQRRFPHRISRNRHSSLTVAYLSYADNVSRLLPNSLSDVNRPVICSRNSFSTPHRSRLAFSLSTPQPLNTTIINPRHVLDRLWLWPRRHPKEQHLAQRPDMIGQSPAIAGVHGRHILAEPVPWVGIGLTSAWRKLMGQDEIVIHWKSTSC